MLAGYSNILFIELENKWTVKGRISKSLFNNNNDKRLFRKYIGSAFIVENVENEDKLTLFLPNTHK